MDGPLAARFQDCHFVSNTVDTGGVVYITGGARPAFIRSRFYNNSAVGGVGGGAVWVNLEGYPTFSHCVFEANVANRVATPPRGFAGAGGAMAVTAQSVVTISGVSISALLMCTHSMLVADCHFTRNAATVGGAVHVEGGTVHIIRSSFVRVPHLIIYRFN